MTAQQNGSEAGSTTNHAQLIESARDTADAAGTCIQEVTCLVERLKAKSSLSNASGFTAFLRLVEGERKSLQTWTDKLKSLVTDPVGTGDALQEERNTCVKRIQATTINITHSVAQWHRLKRCRRLVAVNRTFQGSSRDARLELMQKKKVKGPDKSNMHRILREQGRVEVDVVDGGGEWLAVKSITRSRLAREMSDSGWAWGDHEPGDRVDADEWDDVSVTKFAKKLVAAARMNRHEYRFPRIRLILANLNREDEDEDDDELDMYVHQLQYLDPLVEIAVEYQNGPFMTTPAPDLETALENLVGDPLGDLTPTLNLDHTVLIDLISDLTHADLQPQSWQASTTRAQIEEENQHVGGLMARTLYPLLSGRRLVCTSEAAEHLHNVLDAVGTVAERERGRLLVPWDDQTRSMSTESIRARFQELTIHQLPTDVQLPLDIITDPWDQPAIDKAVSKGILPEVALDVARCSAFKSSKLSIFMYGWAAGIATVTSNKEVRGQINTWVETNRRSDTEVGPLIWRIDVTRNLLAKNASPRPSRVKDRRQEGNGTEKGDYDDEDS